MRLGHWLAAVLLGTAALAGEPDADAMPYRVIPMGDFAAFVKNWDDGKEVFCARIRSRADWDEVFSPAVTMGNTRPTAPDDDFFVKEQLVVVARVIPAVGETGEPLSVAMFRRIKGRLVLAYLYEPPRVLSCLMVKGALLVAVPAEVTGPVYIVEQSRKEIVLPDRTVE